MAADELLETQAGFLKELAPASTYQPGDEGKSLEDLGLDSLDVAGFALKIEETYGVAISDEELETLSTLHDFVAHVAAAKG
jgi:acyl carrier protein